VLDAWEFHCLRQARARGLAEFERLRRLPPHRAWGLAELERLCRLPLHRAWGLAELERLCRLLLHQAQGLSELERLRRLLLRRAFPSRLYVRYLRSLSRGRGGEGRCMVTRT